MFCNGTQSHWVWRTERGGGPGRGRESPWLCLPIHFGHIQFYHFIPGWSGIQQAVGCLSTEPESQVSQGSGASGWVLWLEMQNFTMFCIYFNHLLISLFLGCLRGSEGGRETKGRRDGKEERTKEADRSGKRKRAQSMMERAEKWERGTHSLFRMTCDVQKRL